MEKGAPLSQQDQVSPAPAAPQIVSIPSATAAAAPAPAPLPGRRSSWGRLVIPVLAVLAAFGFVALATLRWDVWVGLAAIQTTDDAYISADTT